jgi:hypothetical protein
MAATMSLPVRFITSSCRVPMNRYGSFANDHDDADRQTEMPVAFRFHAKSLCNAEPGKEGEQVLAKSV